MRGCFIVAERAEVRTYCGAIEVECLGRGIVGGPIG
jgi:hypothetical protein